ncbi:hypothetical protein KDN32_03770 [Nocardioides sp. J2M5]|uniref:hypothetical protein n=1 Tax=Nocardioides palaemonis TaxID=2829810 RepID=UPI001BAC8C66|nr:hypothetical protein [Nocardioides palaemonis]MBS2936860.1 hypothetical protein [Nocardioides palaemonis]
MARHSSATPTPTGTPGSISSADDEQHADGAALTTSDATASHADELSLEDLYPEGGLETGDDQDDPDDGDEEDEEAELDAAELAELAGDVDADAEAGREAVYSGLTKAERDELDALAERIARQASDKELIAELRSNGFEGRKYEVFADDLARYALSVLGGWLRTGHIFTLARRADPYEEELFEFADSKDARTELAVMTIATAMPAFRERALVDSGWDPEKGASLTTYFMGAVVFAFPNQLRDRRRLTNRWQRQDRQHTGELVNLDRGAITDTADLAVGNARVIDHLNSLKPRERNIVAATLDGYSQEEMIEMFGEESVRAIEGVLYRWRTREQRTLHHDPTDAIDNGPRHTRPGRGNR